MKSKSLVICMSVFVLIWVMMLIIGGVMNPSLSCGSLLFKQWKLYLSVPFSMLVFIFVYRMAGD